MTSEQSLSFSGCHWIFWGWVHFGHHALHLWMSSCIRRVDCTFSLGCVWELLPTDDHTLGGEMFSRQKWTIGYFTTLNWLHQSLVTSVTGYRCFIVKPMGCVRTSSCAAKKCPRTMTDEGSFIIRMKCVMGGKIICPIDSPLSYSVKWFAHSQVRSTSFLMGIKHVKRTSGFQLFHSCLLVFHWRFAVSLMFFYFSTFKRTKVPLLSHWCFSGISIARGLTR